DNEGVLKMKSEQEFQKTLADAKHNGKLPVVILVHCSQEPFFTDSGGGAAGGSGGWHAVTITDFDPETAKADIPNQWRGTASHDIDGGIPVDQLYKATTPKGPWD